MLVVLNDSPDALTVQDVVDRVAVLVPPATREWHPSPPADDVPPYEKAIRRASMELAKAGWITKSGGTWQITDIGRAALAEFSEPGAFYEAAVARRDPTVTPTPSAEPVGDIFAGCALTIAGGVVGAVLGTIVLVARMQPDPSLFLVVGFAAALVVGFVVGFLATFGMEGVARGFGRHAQDVWVIGTALAAAASAALTPSLLFAVAASR